MAEGETSGCVETDTMVIGEDDEGNKTINKYAVIQEVGRGAYGKVKLVVDTVTEAFYAIKIMNKKLLAKTRKGFDSDKTRLDDLYYEIAVMKQFRHPNIVTLHEVINDPACNKVYLIMDYVSNGPIWSIGLPPLPTQQLKTSIVGMCKGLDYIHQNNVLHRDIKFDNLLVDETGTPRWCDFGVSSTRDNDGDGKDDIVLDTEGTPAFLTPEQLENLPIPGRMTDMWALGVTIFAMGIGRLPFEGRDLSQLSEQISTCEPAYPTDVEPLLKDLLMGLLHKDLEKRIGYSNGVRDVLKHAFLADVEGVDSLPDISPVSVSEAHIRTAVQTGHNIKLKLSETVNAAMQVQHAKIKLLNRKRERGRRASKQLTVGDVRPTLLSPFDDNMKPSPNFKPAMSPLDPPGLSFGSRMPTEAAPLDPTADTTSTSAPLQNVGAPKLDPAVYLRDKRVPQLVDKVCVCFPERVSCSIIVSSCISF
ncbi:Serine/threonine-protein kinase GRIK1 [Diplonema papillatum]|nr:Serine/threonine-protein kinase GRIK1 [Diplonema papillatum]